MREMSRYVGNVTVELNPPEGRNAQTDRRAIPGYPGDEARQWAVGDEIRGVLANGTSDCRRRSQREALPENDAGSH
jgi:hypothetical protein